MFIAILFIMETGHYGWSQTGNNPNIHQLGSKMGKQNVRLFTQFTRNNVVI